MTSYSVKIDTFEGPLDLLLHLINRMEIDIYDIPMAEITEQYMQYIETMAELELDVASEFLVMAATLIFIKSRTLVPKHEEEEEELLDGEIDPRDELVEQLLEYKRFKEAAVEFKTLEEERALLFTKAPSDLSEFAENIIPKQLGPDLTVYDMLAAFQKLLRRQKLQRPLHTKIQRQEVTIEQRMEEVLKDIRRRKGKVHFTSLFARQDKPQMVVTFLALLELMKLNQIHVEQNSNLEEIFITAKKEVNTSNENELPSDY